MDHKEPVDHKEFINNPKAKKTMEEEVYMIAKNKTRELVDIPRNRKVHQMDVKSTFINGFLEEEISVEQPKGLIVKGKEDKGYLISLGFNKSLLESAPYVKSKGVEWRLSKARMKKNKNCRTNKFELSRQKIGICNSKNQGGVLKILFFNCK